MKQAVKQGVEATISDKAVENSKFRTTPIASTIQHVKELPASAILYKCAASQFWQFRVFLDGAQRKRSTRKTDIKEAQREAKLIYANMLQSIHGDERGKLKLSGKRTLYTVAASLWEKQEVMIGQKELNPQKNKNDKWVFEKHIGPFFRNFELTEIDADTLEQFKIYLAKLKLSKATQRSYFGIVAKLLKEAVKKRYIHTAPILPRVRMDDDPRGYFNSAEYTRLWQTAKRLIGQNVPIFRDEDVVDGKVRDGAKPYRIIAVTRECFDAILFMRNTYVRPTDLKVLQHKNVFTRLEGGFTFLELRHKPTKKHSGIMTSTEYAFNHYKRICAQRLEEGFGNPDDFVFMPQHANRDYALKELARQFEVVVKEAGLKVDAAGKRRTLYSLRHTAIVTAIHAGIEINNLATNARTSVDIINRFYASHIVSVLDRGPNVIERMKAKHARYEAMAEAKALEQMETQ